MTPIEFHWWILDVDPDAPGILEILMKTCPKGKPEIDLEELRIRTERALIGSALAHERIPAGAEKVKARHFTIEGHRLIWAEMLKQGRFDPQLLAVGIAETHPEVDAMPMLTYLTGCEDSFPSLELVPFYAKKVIEGAMRARTEAKA